MQGSQSECTLLTPTQSLITRQSEGRPAAEYSSCSLYAITYLGGTTLKGLSIFGKEMPCVRIMRFLRFLGLAEEGTNVTVLLVLWDNLV